MSDPNTWEDLVGGLELGLGWHQLAHHLLDGAPAPDWGEQPEESSALVTPSTNALAKALLLRMTFAGEKMYCLMVIGNNMMVLHALAEPFELQALGGKFSLPLRATSARW